MNDYSQIVHLFYYDENDEKKNYNKNGIKYFYDEWELS